MQIRYKTEAGRLFFHHLLESYFHGRGENFSLEATLSDGLATVTLSEGDKKHCQSAVVNLLLHQEAKRGESAALGAAFHLAATRFSSYTPPYGTLVGVRPVKVPLFYLKKGYSAEETRRILQEDFFVSPEKASLLTSLAAGEAEFSRSLSPEDCLLYLSIPFCPSRCSYCSFISSAAPSHLALIPAYTEALEREMTETARLLAAYGKKPIAVYMGGGTPGILSPKLLDRILGCVRREFDLSRLREFCVEMGRPDTITKEKLEVLAAHGVDRISINPQTTNNATLQRIGRSHSAEDFFRAMELAAPYSFGINCDLISALPEESGETFLESVTRVLSYDPESVTIHALCQKKSAEDQSEKNFDPIFRKAVEKAYESCINQGLAPYYLYRQKKSALDLENLGFAKKEKIGVYNLAMMEDLCDVFACGAGGITKLLPSSTGDKIRRFAGFKYPFEYLNQPHKAEERLKEIQNCLETMYE